MPIRESDLPGVGKKHEIDLADGTTLIVLTHNTGKREVFKRAHPDADSEKLFELPDQLARTVGTILEGAYFQPIQADMQETTLPGGILLEWYEVQPGADLVGETLASAEVGARTGVTVVAIQRGDETIDSPPPDTEIEEGDTLIVVGTQEDCEAFENLLAGNA